MHPAPTLTENRTPLEPRPSGSRPWISWLVIPMVAMVLYVPGINWGVPSMVSWSQDSISGLRTIGPVRQETEGWRGRYSPLHYYLLYGTYLPVLQYWESQQSDGSTLTNDLPMLTPERTGTLILIARSVSVAMAIAAAWGVWLATFAATRDQVAALAAALSLMLGAAFAYFAHLGNVDVPSTCWIAWSAFFYIRCITHRTWPDALLLGLFGSLAISTKDAAVGIYPGMAVAMIILDAMRLSENRSRFNAAVAALLQPRWAIGLAAFACPYLYLNGVFDDPQPYLDRMQYWLDASADTLHAAQLRYDSPFDLAAATMHYAAAALGWPLLAFTACAAALAVWRQKSIAILTLLPVLSYYLLIIAKIEFVYARFLLPCLVLLAIPNGLLAARLARGTRATALFRFGALGAVLIPTALYASTFGLEMMADTRYAAEQWFADHVPTDRSVGAFLLDEKYPLRPQYLPRVHEMGYATYPVAMSDDSFQRPQPEYLILTSYNYQDFNASQRQTMATLLSGVLGYETAAEFQASFLPDPHDGKRTSWLPFAGLGTPATGKISPTIRIMRRTPHQSAAPPNPRRHPIRHTDAQTAP